jgi:hypothetical protein
MSRFLLNISSLVIISVTKFSDWCSLILAMFPKIEWKFPKTFIEYIDSFFTFPTTVEYGSQYNEHKKKEGKIRQIYLNFIL